MHRISPISFRLGKTYPWKYNVLLNNSAELSISKGGPLGFTKGLERIAEVLLEKQRIFSLRGTLQYNLETSQACLYLLYVPRMKQKPSERFRTTNEYFSKLIYSHREHQTGNKAYRNLLRYSIQRLYKKAPIKRRKYRALNK
jgi:hypothetical protein